MEKMFNLFVEYLYALLNLILRGVRLIFGWHGVTLEGNGVSVVLYRIRDGVLEVLVHRHPIRKGLQLIGGGVAINEEYKPSQGDLMSQASAREVCEEIGVELYRDECRLEAMFQQRTSVGGFFMTTFVGVTSFCFDTLLQERWPQERWKLQAGEVSEVMWMDIVEAIIHTEKSHPQNFLSLAYRRMLIIFYENYEHRHSVLVSKPSLHIGRLDQPLEFRIPGSAEEIIV